MAGPNFQLLWQAFPDHIQYPTLEDLYNALGGAAQKNIHVPGFGPTGNTCASRLSVAFNNGGSPIDHTTAKLAGARTVGAADGSRVIYGVADFRKYLIKILGEPTKDLTTPFDDSFVGRKGIISFKVNWQGATGHIALWNGMHYREPNYDNYSTYVNDGIPSIRTSESEFWELT